MLTELCRSQLNDRNNDFPFHNEATESYDCNVAMCSQSVQLVNGKKLTSHEVRVMGSDLTGGTGTALARAVFRKQGFVAGTDFLTMNGWATADVIDLLAKPDEWFVVAYIKYDIMREKAPDIVGDGNYNLAHAVGLSNFWRADGIRRTHYHDPLNDGRRSASLGGRAPKGVQTAKWRDVRDAAWEYSEVYEKKRTGRGSGYIYGYAVKPRP